MFGSSATTAVIGLGSIDIVYVTVADASLGDKNALSAVCDVNVVAANDTTTTGIVVVSSRNEFDVVVLG